MSEIGKQHLMVFLEWAEQKGLMKKATARSLRSACGSILSVLDESESEDLSKVDIEAVIQRYQNLNGMTVSPNTMQTYGNRAKYAIEEFLKYNKDKAGWKPSGGHRPASNAQNSRKGRGIPKGPPEGFEAGQSTGQTSMDPSQITHQFPIRRDLVVTVKGIPFDVKRSEMARLNAYLSNLVAEEEADEQMQPRLNPAPADVAAN